MVSQNFQLTHGASSSVAATAAAVAAVGTDVAVAAAAQRFHAGRPCLDQQFGRDSWPMRRRRKTLIGGRAMGLRWRILWLPRRRRRRRLQLGQDLRSERY